MSVPLSSDPAAPSNDIRRLKSKGSHMPARGGNINRELFKRLPQSVELPNRIPQSVALATSLLTSFWESVGESLAHKDFDAQTTLPNGRWNASSPSTSEPREHTAPLPTSAGQVIKDATSRTHPLSTAKVEATSAASLGGGNGTATSVAKASSGGAASDRTLDRVSHLETLVERSVRERERAIGCIRTNLAELEDIMLQVSTTTGWPPKRTQLRRPGGQIDCFSTRLVSDLSPSSPHRAPSVPRQLFVPPPSADQISHSPPAHASFSADVPSAMPPSLGQPIVAAELSGSNTESTRVVINAQAGGADWQSDVSGLVAVGITRQRSAGLFLAENSRSSSPTALTSLQEPTHGSAAAPSPPSLSRTSNVEQHCLLPVSRTPVGPAILNQARKNYSAPCLQPTAELISEKGHVVAGYQGGEADAQSSVTGALLTGRQRPSSLGLLSPSPLSPMEYFSQQTRTLGSAAAPASSSPSRTWNADQHCLSPVSNQLRRNYSAPCLQPATELLSGRGPRVVDDQGGGADGQGGVSGAVMAGVTRQMSPGMFLTESSRSSSPMALFSPQTLPHGSTLAPAPPSPSRTSSLEQHCPFTMSRTPVGPAMLHQLRRNHSAPCLQPAAELLSGKGQVVVSDHCGGADGQRCVGGPVMAGVTRQRSPGPCQASSSRSASPMALFSPQTPTHGSAVATAPPSPSRTPTLDQHCLFHVSRTSGELAMLNHGRRQYFTPGLQPATTLLCGKGQAVNNVIGAPPPRAACISVAAAAQSTPTAPPGTTILTRGLPDISKEKALGKELADVGDALDNIGRVRAKQCQLEEAVELYDRALDIREKALSKEHAVIGDMFDNMTRARGQ